MSDLIKGCLLGLFSGGSFATLVVFLIQRFDNRRNQSKEILEAIEANKKETEKRLDYIEKQQKENMLADTRIEMSIQMLHHPKNKQTILKLAEKYFKELHGDYYMTSCFNDWLKKNHVARPLWFDPSK